ncbi:hypothetical protein FBU30_003514 [Linnemannia zychae]|nr:hypothetical protein FBU30_003514 [Linnemannia zychae]
MSKVAMCDKQEYVEDQFPSVTESDHSGLATHIGGLTNADEAINNASKLGRTASMEHQDKAQASLDVEMAKARISKSEPSYRRWIVLATATLGALLVSLQGSALIVALPDLMRELDIDFATIIWVLLTYTLAITASVPLLGYVGDAGLRGIRCRMFNIGFFVFTLGSLLCGIAQKKYSGYDLLGYRVVQGLGGALLFSNCFAIVADKFYPYNQVGLASGIINIAFAAGTILGPVIGGATVKASWKWVFFFNLPFGAVGTLAGFIFCHDTIYSHVEYTTLRKLVPVFDYTGFISLTATLALLFVVVVSALFPNGKVSVNSSLIGMGVAMGVLFIVFIIQQTFIRGGEHYDPTRAPFMDFNLFKNWVFNNTVVLGGLAGGVARTNLTFSFIFFFQGPYSKDPLMAGILLIPFGLGIMIAGMPSGRMADKIGFRYLCAAGLGLASIATLIMPLIIKPETNTWSISALLLVNGLGWGLYQSPSASISMLCILPQQRSASSSLRIMFTMLSQMIAIVICFKIIISGMPPEAVQELFIYGGGIDAKYLPSFMHGFRIVCWITFAITLLCCICAWGLPIQPVIAKPEPDSESDTLDYLTGAEADSASGAFGARSISPVATASVFVLTASSCSKSFGDQIRDENRNVIDDGIPGAEWIPEVEPAAPTSVYSNSGLASQPSPRSLVDTHSSTNSLKETIQHITLENTAFHAAQSFNDSISVTLLKLSPHIEAILSAILEANTKVIAKALLKLKHDLCSDIHTNVKVIATGLLTTNVDLILPKISATVDLETNKAINNKVELDTQSIIKDKIRRHGLVATHQFCPRADDTCLRKHAREIVDCVQRAVQQDVIHLFKALKARLMDHIRTKVALVMQDLGVNLLVQQIHVQAAVNAVAKVDTHMEMCSHIIAKGLHAKVRNHAASAIKHICRPQ